MKNLTRVLALVLVFSLIMGTVAFAAFTDVKETDDYAEAIETLAGFDIIKGYEDGTFGADKAITRAEAVAIINRIQNLSAAAEGAKGASLYTDVKADHWAIGDINLATQMGTVSGDGNGLFRPDDQVSYQEMVKMLVVALGYQPAVNDKGGWPTGYLVVASQQGILDDTANGGAAPATRGVVAQLTFNALTAPMMEQTGYGDDKKFEVKDVAGAKKTLLTEKLSIYKVDVVPVASDVAAIAGNTVEVGKVKVEIDINKATTRSESDAFYGVKLPFAVANTGKTTETFVAGSADLGANLGYEATAYIKKNADKEWEVVYSEPGDVRVFDIEASLIDSVANNIINVVDEDNDIDDEYEIDANTVVVKDNVLDANAITAATFKYADGAALEGTVRMVINGKSDDVIDYIFVDTFKTDRVDDVSPNGKSIVLTQNAPIKLDTKENKNLVYSLTLDGKDITPAEVKEGDIVTYRNKGLDFYEIVVSRATVEGAITSSYVEDGATHYTIGGNEYVPSKSAYNNGLTKFVSKNGVNYEISGVRPGVEGIFYLDAFGKVAWFERTTAVAADKNYAYVVSMGLTNTSAMDPKYGIEILTAEGKLETIDFANKINIITNSLVSGNVTENVANAVQVLTGTTPVGTLTAAVSAGDLITYSKNTSGEISEITVWSGANAARGDDFLFTKNGTLTQAEYKARTGRIGNFVVTDDTIVFYVHGTDKDEYKVDTAKFFADEDRYSGVVYGAIDGDTGIEAGAIVVTSQATSAIEKGDVAVFVKVATILNAEGTKVAQIEFYQDGALKTVAADSQAPSGLNTLVTGDIFNYTLNAKGEITTITEMTPGAINYAYPASATAGAITYVFGQVYDRSGKSVRIGDFHGAWDAHNIPENLPVYLVDYSGSKVKVSVGAINEVTKNRYTNANELYAEDDADNFMMTIKYKGQEVVGAVIYKNMINVTATNAANGGYVLK